ncbi:serine/threonine-protein kinase N2-like [Xenopus tropicalis]|uniref:Serine/threonine-protein kinase N2-like n=1 Tax=Xenopus tropicalis TaxID=8364 RepID=A0A8J1J1P5_XENTR|nr:serine/threonine-protein kinase N2-like [Xenopus tropicalis]
MIPIEDFQFRKWLGQGSFGKVFMAEHKKTGKKVAIKMMEKLHICYNQMTESLFLERDILRLSRNSRNPFLVSLVCAFQREHHVYIAMEFAAGGSLASHLGNGALPHTSTLFYSACIVLGIKFLHENRIVHRDLKPDNIVIDGAGYAQLADFGLCKTGIDFRDVMPYPCGTINYWAPEMFSGEGYKRTVDWWALGVIIYEMAVGKMPFHGNKEVLRDSILNKEPEYPAGLDGGTRVIIKELLEKDPEYRLGSLRNDGEEVMNFSFFNPIMWNALMAKQIRAPFVPSQDIVQSEAGNDGAIVTPHNCTSRISHFTQKAFIGFDMLPEDSS